MEQQQVDQMMRERAERIEIRDGAEYAIVSAESLTSEEFAAVIMSEVRKLQESRNAG